MSNHTTTFEEIERKIDALDLKAFQLGGGKHVTSDAAARAPGSVLERICEIYKAIRGVLVALENLPLIPKKWRDAIKTFLDSMDQVCPTQ